MDIFTSGEYQRIIEENDRLHKEHLASLNETYQENPEVLEDLSLIFNSLESLEERNEKSAYLVYQIQQLFDCLDAYFDEDEEAVFDLLDKAGFGSQLTKLLETKDVIESASILLDSYQKNLCEYYETYFLDKKEIYTFELGQKKSHQLSYGFKLLSQSDQDEKHIERINTALAKIEKYHPQGFERLKTFTKNIIPINQDEIVSYSMQSTPYNSIINLFNRDDFDLLDDLLHENGHHHLNHYLNLYELIIEDDDKDYYSPWRESFRPIRGLYHAVYTFYFALELYYILSQQEEFKGSKCAFRFCEEYLKLTYSLEDLECAKSKNKITADGYQLILFIKEKIEETEHQFDKALDRLSEKEKSEIEALNQHLKKMRIKTSELSNE